MIHFQVIRFKNFLSTGNAFTEIHLDKHNTTLIVGENGAGKSTILDALTFGLFGKPFRKVNKPQLVNSVNQKGTMVEIEFRVGKKQYIVKRGIKPAVFEIYENSKLLNQPSTTKDYQSILERMILKLNYKSFTQIVILGVSSFIPFMQLPAAHRRDVIEDLLDIQIFTSMNVLLKEKVQENKGQINYNTVERKLCDEKVALQEDYITLHKENTKKRVDKYKKEIKSLDRKIITHGKAVDKLGSNKSNMMDTIKDGTSVSKRLRKFQKFEHQIKTKIANLQKTIEFYTDNENCPTCKQQIDEKQKDKIVTRKTKTLAENMDGFDQLQKEIDIVADRLDQIAEVEKRIAEVDEKITNEQNAIITLTSYKNRLVDETESLCVNKKDLTKATSKLKTLEKDKTELKKQKTELLEEMSLFNIASMLLKDTGIKTKIIKQYIPLMNKLINKYLASMDFFVNFELDENFNETIRSRHRDDFSYGNFSEGEKQRIDVALLLCWRAVAKKKNSASTNLLILDEIFDASLDENGTDELMKILQTIGEGTNIFIISHKKDTLVDKFNNVIHFETYKNFSRIQ
tara:strand:- start:6656 stop:8368 length:1713 start_codon:yes stop_codon:yes gene_type:complete